LEAPSYDFPDDGGKLEFTLSPDGNSFVGKWCYGEAEDWYGEWTATKKGGATPKEENVFLGLWETNWGQMRFVEVGDSVQASYGHDEGVIKGVVRNGVLTGVWLEAPTYEFPDDGGQVEFIIAPDANSFLGKWRYGDSGEWHENDWQGKRLE